MSRAGTWKGGWEYFDADSGGLGLYGFMEGETLMPGVAELPEEDIQLVRNILDQMLKGEVTRFDVFKGPIYDNRGNLILPEGVSLEQADLDGFKEFGSPATSVCIGGMRILPAELPPLIKF
jgi:basic membrane protein A